MDGVEALRNNAYVGSRATLTTPRLHQRIDSTTFTNVSTQLIPSHWPLWPSINTKILPVAPQDGFRTVLPRPQGKGTAPEDASAGNANHALQTLLARNYRGDIPMSAVEKFPILLS